MITIFQKCPNLDILMLLYAVSAFQESAFGVLYHNGNTDTIILPNHIVYQEVNTFIGLSC